MLVGPAPGLSHRSLCHRKHKKISCSRFALEKNFELYLWASLRGGNISLISLHYGILSEKLHMNVRGRVKTVMGDGAFKVKEQESFRRATIHKA